MEIHQELEFRRRTWVSLINIKILNRLHYCLWPSCHKTYFLYKGSSSSRKWIAEHFSAKFHHSALHNDIWCRWKMLHIYLIFKTCILTYFQIRIILSQHKKAVWTSSHLQNEMFLQAQKNSLTQTACEQVTEPPPQCGSSHAASVQALWCYYQCVARHSCILPKLITWYGCSQTSTT